MSLFSLEKHTLSGHHSNNFQLMDEFCGKIRAVQHLPNEKRKSEKYRQKTKRNLRTEQFFAIPVHRHQFKDFND